MRKDLKDVIINTSKYGFPSKKYSRHGKHRDLDHDYWNDEKEVIKPKDKTQSDRLSPLFKFLESRVGQSWNKVWSEVCQQNDNRNIRGYHLRRHLLDYVTGNTISKEFLSSFFIFFGHFYVDEYGILRKNKNREYRKYRPKKIACEFTIKKNGETYCKTQNGWFLANEIPKEFLEVMFCKVLFQEEKGEYWRFIHSTNLKNYRGGIVLKAKRLVSSKEMKKILTK